MNVLAISITFIPSIILCGHSQLNHLEKLGKINYKFVISHFINKKNIEWADVIVFIRCDTDLDMYVSKIAKKAGKHLVYVLDDDILNVPSYISSAPNYLKPSTKKQIRTIMSNCDTFLTTSPVLLEKYGKGFKNAFLINEPSLNRIDKKEKNKKIKVGFAGSIDRAQDLNQILRDTIEKLVNKYHDEIDIEFMGAKPKFVEEFGLTYLPYQDGYDAYTAFMSKCNWDIGLAPMPDTEFHRCKYYNKFVEYASFGIVGVYSNLEPYVYGIKDGVNGLLVNNTTDEWYNAIVRLIEDNKLRETISKECLRQANEIYTLEKCADDYYNKMCVGYKKPNKNVNIPNLALAKFRFVVVRGFRKIKEEGTNFPNWLQKKIDKKIQDIKEEKQDNINKEKLKDIISKQKTICVIAPMFDDLEGEYNNRVKLLDNNIDCYKIYLSGENRMCEHIMVNFIDDTHVSVVFNSYDILQTEEIFALIKQSGHLLIHSVIRFMSEKLSSDMFEVFNLENINVVWDVHGMIPEAYHENANYHIEQVVNDIEKDFYDKSDVVLVDDEKLIEHFKDKYNKDQNFVVYNGNTKDIDLNKII
ncbi:MAG: hypothetical protein Q4E33_01360 [Erysipelotrichaceae bacterium]|nr:hypothetical protein [Erysipelotrichaceae bacterium]